jgi:hypothetical protein
MVVILEPGDANQLEAEIDYLIDLYNEKRGQGPGLFVLSQIYNTLGDVL